MEGLKSLAIGALWGTQLVQDTEKEGKAYKQRLTNSEVNTIAQIKLMDATTVFTAQTWGFSNTTLIFGELLSAGVIYGAHRFGFLPKSNVTGLVTFGLNIVNTIALLYFGNIVMSLAVCGMFTFGVLDGLNKLPASVSNVYRSVISNQWIMAITGIVVSFGSLMQLRHTVKLVLLVTQKIDVYTPPPRVLALI